MGKKGASFSRGFSPRKWMKSGDLETSRTVVIDKTSVLTDARKINVIKSVLMLIC